MSELPYESVINGFTGLISEFITDDDLKNKLDFEAKKLKFELDKTLLQTNTTPNVDAFVKIMIAMRDIIIPMFRPVGSAVMSCFGAYCIYAGIVLPESIQYLLFGSPLAYGVSRHLDKGNKQKTKREAIRLKEIRGAVVTDDDYE